jgi:transposase
MAGRPLKRQREREATLAAQQAAGRARPRAKNQDPATRQATVERAAKIGDAAAAAEVGVSSATVRSWRRRQKAEATNPAATTPSSVDMPQTSVDGDAVAQMRSTAGLARDLAEEAARQSQGAMRAGEAVKVRELSASAKMWAATATSLEQASAVAASAEIRLTEAQGRLIVALIKDYHAAIGVPLTPSARTVLRHLLEQGERGSETPPPDAERAAEEIRGHFRQTLAAELAAEAVVELAEEGMSGREVADVLGVGEATVRRDLDASNDAPEHEDASENGGARDRDASNGADTIRTLAEQEPDDGLPAWDELPDEWQRKYALQPHLGRHEYANALKREALTGPLPPTRPSRFAHLRHPGLR